MRYLRRIWRAAFGWAPIYLDGGPVKALMAQGFSWEEALLVRSHMNTCSLLAWREGAPDSEIFDRRLRARNCFPAPHAMAGIDAITDAAA